MNRLIKLLLTGLLLNALFVGYISQSHAQLFSSKFQSQQNKLLKEDDSFKFSASLSDDGKLSVLWDIADDYYMYRDTFKIVSNTAQVKLGELIIPTGKIIDDPEFGKVQVYFS